MSNKQSSFWPIIILTHSDQGEEEFSIIESRYDLPVGKTFLIWLIDATESQCIAIRKGCYVSTDGVIYLKPAKGT